MVITDQVATAPCTDPVQASGPTFEAKPQSGNIRDVRVFFRPSS